MEMVDKVLMEIEDDIRKGRFIPIVGPVKGKLLSVLTKISGPKDILEIGTAVGYSSLLMYKASGRKAKITTIELDAHLAREAKENFKKARADSDIRVKVGDAKKVLRRTRSKYDMIFLDIGKEHYLDVLKDCVRILRRGGLLVADNALWEELARFRDRINTHPKLDSTIVNVSDGMAVSIKR